MSKNRRRRCPVLIAGLTFCIREATTRILWHDDGYENRKYVTVCSQHAEDIKNGKHITW